jgi:hypothetical protein
MRLLIVVLSIFSVGSCCRSSQPDCAADEIAYGTLNCIKKEGFTFYQADVNFYCFNRSVLLGLDIEKKILKPYYINTYNPVNREVMGSLSDIFYNNCFYCGYNIECTINNSYKVTWLLIEDKEQFSTIPAVIKAKLVLKESVDFFSNTLEETDIILNKRS